MIKALIFDFDGLIMDTESPEVDGWKAIYAEYGQEFPIQVWVRDVVGATLANFDPAAHLAAISGRKLDLPALRSRAHSNRLQELSTLSALSWSDRLYQGCQATRTAAGCGIQLGTCLGGRVSAPARFVGIFRGYPMPGGRHTPQTRPGSVPGSPGCAQTSAGGGAGL